MANLAQIYNELIDRRMPADASARADPDRRMSFLRRLGAWLLGRRASAAWMSDSLLLVAGRPGRDRGCELRAQAQAGGTEVRLYACPDAAWMRATLVLARASWSQSVGHPLRRRRPSADEGADRGRRPGAGGPRRAADVARACTSIRDAARGELPPLTAEQGAALAVNVDAIMALDERVVLGRTGGCTTPRD